MSYSRTVDCGWCGYAGHNKRTCSGRMEYAKRNPKSHVAREIKKEREKKRQCGYCKKTGHNRKTCLTWKRDKDYATKKNKKFIGYVSNILKDLGVGVGALVSCPRYEDPENEAFYLVTGIDWSKIDMLCFTKYPRYRPIKLRRLSDDLTNKVTFRFFDTFMDQLIASFENEKEYASIPETREYYRTNTKIVSSLTPEQVEKQLPINWQENAILSDEAWQDRGDGSWRSRTYIHNDFLNK